MKKTTADIAYLLYLDIPHVETNTCDVYFPSNHIQKQDGNKTKFYIGSDADM